MFFFPSASTSSLSFWTNPTTFGSWDVEEKVCPDVSESIPNVLAIAIHIYLSYCLFVSKKGKVNINNLKMPLITFFLMLQWRPFEFECSKQTDCYRPSVSPSSTFTCVHDFPSRKKAHKVQMQQTHTHTQVDDSLWFHCLTKREVFSSDPIRLGRLITNERDSRPPRPRKNKPGPVVHKQTIYTILTSSLDSSLVAWGCFYFLFFFFFVICFISFSSLDDER